MSDDLTRRISDEILHRIVAPEEGDIVPVVTAENAQEIAADASRAIASLIAEREAAVFNEAIDVAEGRLRMCLTCGKTRKVEEIKPGDELPECIGPDGMAACSFDTTPHEAVNIWMQRWHDLHQSLSALRASARREALEEAAKWHDERAERTRRTLERGMSLAMRDTLDTVAYHHEQSAAAIRSLAKEAPDAE